MKPRPHASKPKPARRPPRHSDKPLPRVVVERHGPLHAEIVIVGRELLRGEVDDGNARYIAAELTRRGALVHRVTVVDDLDRSIAQAVSESLARGVHLVVTAGGLGPAVDDRTLAGLSDALRLPLAHSAAAKEMIEAAYPDSGLTSAREQMCFLPVGAEPLPNSEGVAPGMLARRAGGGTVVSLPGRPPEARAVLEEALARLKDLFPLRAFASREVEAPTADESALRPLLERVSGEYPGVWIKSHPGARRRKSPARVTLRSFATNQKEADALVDGAIRRLLALAGNR